MIKEEKRFRFPGIIAITAVFFIIAVILFVERSGIQYNYSVSTLSLLPEDKTVTKAEACAELSTDTLVIYNSKDEQSVLAYNQFSVILSDMKVGYELNDMSCENPDDFSKYEKVIVLLSDFKYLGEDILTLCDWVYKGGRAMFPLTLQKSAYTAIVENKLGIIDSSYDYIVVDSMYVEEDFMVGGGRSFNIGDAFDSGWAVQLADERVNVHIYTNDGKKSPLLWDTEYGKGKFVLVNIGLYEKVLRGFYAAAYSLLDDVCVYPVINGSTFYLDDFPSQIPSGNSEFISRDYNTTIRDFYVNIWWPDMMNFSDKYGIKYTGLAIECYDDSVDGTTDALPDEGTFLNFGNMLLRRGGEIGYHGYNHQPLCFDNCDYRGEFDYKTWESYEAMKSAFDELEAFCDRLFPDVNMAIYVPPSNILSVEGREFLVKEYPQIKTISGIYFEDAKVDFSCVQEFDVAEDGRVDQPRVVSGCKMDDYMQLAVISELNFHFINNHFTHPDDALDPDRGAEIGWEKLKYHFDEYLSYLKTSAPMLRNFTGTEMSAAVQRFASLTVDTEVSDTEMTIKLGNFYDNAQLFVRFNEKKPGKVSGGKLTNITGDLYLLEANKDNVKIDLIQE